MDNMNIRRALAESGMELPADRPVPAKLVEDLHTPPGLDDGGAGIVEQPERFDEFTGGTGDNDTTPRVLAAQCFRVNGMPPMRDRYRLRIGHPVAEYADPDGAWHDTNISYREASVYVKHGYWQPVDDAPLPTTDPASRAIAAHKTPWKIADDTQLRASELRDIIAAFSIDRVSLTLAVERYGLRMYKAGADFTLGCMSGGGK